MKVLCIAGQEFTKCWNSDRGVIGVVEGSTYTVVETKTGWGVPYYILEECEPDVGYEVDWFIPLSSIDETTFERNYKSEPCSTSL